MPAPSAPDIAIIMLTYNHAWSLRESLDSLLAQTYSNFHLLIVDDCSKDDSFAIAESYRDKFTSCTVLRNEQNKGAIKNYYDSLQLLEEQAPNAQFFLWACPDDRWSPTYLERTRATLLDNPGAVAAQTYFETLHLNDNHITAHHLKSLKAFNFTNALQVFRPYQSEAGISYYNDMLHGLLRFSELRNIYPSHLADLYLAQATEISMLLVMLMRGEMLVVPETLFHKKSAGSFADLHPHDPLTGIYGSITYRLSAIFKRLLWLLKMRTRRARLPAVLFGWACLFYPYFVLVIRRKIAARRP